MSAVVDRPEPVAVLADLIEDAPRHGRSTVIGITGSIAVGKSHLAAAIAGELTRRRRTAVVVGTDGFLRSNAELGELGMAMRKGFPESFDRERLAHFLVDASDGAPDLRVPTYDHFRYDVGPEVPVGPADVVVVEGLCLLGPGAESSAGPLADLLDLSVFVEAADESVRQWHTRRFIANAERATDEPGGFWDLFAGMSADDLAAAASFTWDAINGPNVVEHLAPGRHQADVVVTKGPDHAITSVVDRR